MPAAAEQVGPYVLEAEIGRGAHGVVWRAHRADRPDDPVALKVVASRTDLDHLLEEPALLARLDHPCIVRVDDYFVDGSRLVIALEYIRGDDLKTLLDRGATFTPTEVREFLLQIGGALAEAHAQQIVHRDLKPANVMVERIGGRLRFVLTDFGIGRRDEGVQTEKHAGGTYHFMAPEQLRGRPTPQSDLWALGVVAYRLLTGRLPFPGPSLAELSRQILYASPPPPGQLCPEPIDPELEAAVLQLLDKSLTERTAAAAQLLRQLGHTGDSRTVLDRPARTQPAARGETLAVRLSRGVRRKRIWMWAFIGLYLGPKMPGGLLTLGAMALFYLGQSRHAQGRPKARALTLAAFALAVTYLAGAVLLSDFLANQGINLTTPGKANKTLNSWFGEFGTTVIIAVGGAVGALLGLLMPPLASARFAEWRRLRREQALLEAATASGAGSDDYLHTLREMLANRFEDVGFHLKYAEALFARGDHRAAAVEARLLLEQDPWHFNGNLLLANAYFSLGLCADALAVCDGYLKVAGSCFEFTELRGQCLRRLGRS
jgi:tetratricopeptide (TPR) repeat protein